VVVPGWLALGEAWGADVSPPTGVVPGAGCAVGVLAGVVLAGVVLAGVVLVVDCALNPAANASVTVASETTLNPSNAVFMTPTSGTAAVRAASLHSLDASILLFGNKREE
jgi:hypothetical protein